MTLDNTLVITLLLTLSPIVFVCVVYSIKYFKKKIDRAQSSSFMQRSRF
jgi:hypothetical protein